MSVLQDISKQLLAVASMPPEKRNSALMEVKILIEGIQYDMVLEQKDLIINIIDELIAENDADQIAKSKLVFVPDVEEQIAPTKKTRAKKVVAPVVEVESKDLPDFIGEFPIIRTLPEPVRKLAGLRRKELHQNINNFNENDNLSTAFNWNLAPEGIDFWDKISNDGDLTEFKRKYGNKGEKVDEVIEFAEINEFVEGLSKPSTSAPAPAVKTRKPRTPKIKIASPIVQFVELTLEILPSGDVINLIVENPTELQLLVNLILEKLDTLEFIFDFGVHTESNNYKKSVLLKIYNSPIVTLQKLQKEYDTFVKPELDWDNFRFRASDSITIENNEEIINNVFQPAKPVVAPVVAPKPVKVVTPKAVAPKPAKVVTPKPVKVVAPKVVKTKVTKPKVEDDLSFLNDLDNIF